MIAKTIEQTCNGCPSSWAGGLTDGRHWRIRYRWGILRLTVDFDPNKMSVFSQEAPDVEEEFQIGGSHDGFICLDQVKEVIGHLIDLGQAEWVDEARRRNYE